MTLSPFFSFISAPPYNTSGASDTIFVNSLSLNSLATGPKIRVPFGLLSSLMMTAALSSNFTNEPSARRIADFVLTITALTISSKKFRAHDEKNEANTGDVVRITECRPLSRTKRFRLIEIVEKHEKID